MTLAIVLDGSGFPRRSRVFAGNASEPARLNDMLSGLGHLFISALAYRFVQTLRLQLKACGIDDSWQTLRETLTTQQRVTATLQRRDGRTVPVRKASRPEPQHQKKLNEMLGHSPNPGGTHRVLVQRDLIDRPSAALALQKSSAIRAAKSLQVIDSVGGRSAKCQLGLRLQAPDARSARGLASTERSSNEMKLSSLFEGVGWALGGLRVRGLQTAALALLAASSTFAGPTDSLLLAQMQDIPGVREAQRAARDAERAARNAERQAERASREGDRRSAGDDRRSARDQREHDCARIKAWLSDTSAVPPEVLERRFGGGGAARTDPVAPATQLPYESWLFQDARFAPTFGKRFDEVPADERAALQQAGNGCVAPRNARGQAISDNVLFLRAFDPRYHPGYAQGVQKIREAQSQIDTAKKGLALLTPDDDGLRRYRELAAQAARLSLFLGAEQRSAYQQALAQAQTRVAQPVLARRAGEAVAQANGYTGLTALVELQSEMARDGGAVPPGLRERQADIARELVAQERSRIDALGSGLVGLERGVQWHRDYATRYGARLVPAVPQLRAMLEHFELRRAAILDASQAELGARIAQVKSDAELQQLVAQYIPLEFDQRQASGTGLLTRVAAQRETLHKRSVIGTSPVAAVPAPATTQAPAAPARAPAPSADGGPSESEMYDAFNALLQAQNEQAAGIAERCNNRDFQGDPVLAMQCLQYGMGVGTTRGGQGVLAPQFKISRFEKLGCEKAQGETGFRCDYVAGIAGNVNLPPSLNAVVKNGSVTQARFVKRGSGWLLLPDRQR